ncbi:MAG: hypothetical protein QG625_1907 [Cyanobacteriota bacterium erpe_2018_sw_39hr_WHONDRS-SW48-000098_B_bin.30]|nr:hypothetical protein [Cyanobacteriota bacterium erpe_2018_sw_39hr_WHONDRS-SW48-000098_B_bin.30]
MSMMLHKSDEFKKSVFACLIICLGTTAQALAINPPDKALTKTQSAPVSDQAIDKELTVLENRFFFHHYGHDPVAKRLERVELLILGASQSGAPAARLDSLKKAVVVKDKEAAQVMREQSKAQAGAQGIGQSNAPGKGSGGSAAGKAASYPQVATLEWKILKKTYPQEALDQRLNRLEEQLFGVPSTAMSYLDRIERLKKTTGVDVALAPSDTGVKVPGKRQPQFGPLPRAYSGGSGLNPFGGNGLSPFGGSGASPFGASPFFESMPFSDKAQVEEGTDGSGGHYRTFRDGNTFGWSYSTKNLPMPHTMPGQSPRPLGDMFDDMNRQMNEMMRQFNGVEEMPFPISPYGNNGSGGGGSNGGGSGGKNPRIYTPKPFSKVTPLTPRTMPGIVPQIEGRSQPAQKDELPPYSDPNSI